MKSWRCVCTNSKLKMILVRLMLMLQQQMLVDKLLTLKLSSWRTKLRTPAVSSLRLTKDLKRLTSLMTKWKHGAIVSTTSLEYWPKIPYSSRTLQILLESSALWKAPSPVNWLLSRPDETKRETKRASNLEKFLPTLQLMSSWPKTSVWDLLVEWPMETTHEMDASLTFQKVLSEKPAKMMVTRRLTTTQSTTYKCNEKK